MQQVLKNRIALVVIGRNEGAHLAECLAGPNGQSLRVVYVDSGSTDNSVEIARAAGVAVIELDDSAPYTAARGRNAGFAWVQENHPDIKLVQFVDGDCVLMDDWLAKGTDLLSKEMGLAAVCGRVRERYPTQTIYNRLCDAEFTRSPGEVAHCGGIFMVRTEAFQSVGGFNAALPAGEEPEFCLRLRHAGWRLWRLADEMALHDSNLTRFNQWWKRTERSGFAYAIGRALHGGKPEYFCVKECRSICFWGVIFPLVIAILALPTGGWSLLLVLLYLKPLLGGIRAQSKAGQSLFDSALYAGACILAKLPQAIGVFKGGRAHRRARLAASKEQHHQTDKAPTTENTMQNRFWSSQACEHGN